MEEENICTMMNSLPSDSHQQLPNGSTTLSDGLPGHVSLLEPLVRASSGEEMTAEPAGAAPDHGGGARCQEPVKCDKSEDPLGAFVIDLSGVVTSSDSAGGTKDESGSAGDGDESYFDALENDDSSSEEGETTVRLNADGTVTVLTEDGIEGRITVCTVGNSVVGGEVKVDYSGTIPSSNTLVGVDGWRVESAAPGGCSIHTGSTCEVNVGTNLSGFTVTTQGWNEQRVCVEVGGPRGNCKRLCLMAVPGSRLVAVSSQHERDDDEDGCTDDEEWADDEWADDEEWADMQSPASPSSP